MSSVLPEKQSELLEYLLNHASVWGSAPPAAIGLTAAQITQLESYLEVSKTKYDELLALRAEGTEPGMLSWALCRELEQLTELARAARAGQPLVEHFSRLRIWQSRQQLIQQALTRLPFTKLQQLWQLMAQLDDALRRLRELDEDVFRTTEELGIDLSRPERGSDEEDARRAAERALRHAVIWRKLSFGTQSAAGSRFVERMLTVIETCRRAGTNAFAWLTQAVRAYFGGQQAPSLAAV